MTREEAIKSMEYSKAQAEITLSKGVTQYWKQEINWTIEAIDMAIEALKREQPDEWCTDCKECDTEKKCCPRFNKVIREAMKRVPHEDGTLEVKVEDATKIRRVLITDDKHRGGLYYPDEDEPKGEDLISRADAIEALGEEPLVWCDEDYEIAERSQWRADIEAIKSVPSADRPRGEWIHTPNGIDRDFVWWVCSECGHKIFSETIKDRIEFHAYCGRCGAYMRGDTERC